jgi:hypothetical protein
MPNASRSEQEFLRVRAIARQLLLEHGSALAAGSAVVTASEEADDAIGALVTRHQPTLERETDSLLDELITDADVARQVSDHHGTLMAAYGDAGYFFGLCTGLEMASLMFGEALTVRGRASKKGRRR